MTQYMKWYASCAIPFALWSFLLAQTHPSRAREPEPSADEVLLRSKEAMKGPIRYRVVHNGVANVVYHKVLPGGVTATRIDMSHPVPKTSILLGKHSFEIYLDRGIGIDTSLMLESSLQRFPVSALGANQPGTTQVKELLLDGHRACFELIKTYPADLSAAFENSLPAAVKKQVATMVPRESRTIVDRESFVTLETRTVSEAGLTLSRSEYRDIERPAELQDDLFLPPDGIELWKPHNRQEYAGMVRDILSPRPDDSTSRHTPAQARSRTVPAFHDRVARARPEIDPHTGRITPSPLPIADRKQPDRHIALSRGRADTLTANDIVSRCKKAMRTPIRYRFIRDGVSMLVSQVAYVDGTSAIRLETLSPEHTISIALEKISYTFYPDRGLGIETSFMQETLAAHIDPIATVLDAKFTDAAEPQDSITDDGRKCFAITTQYFPLALLPFDHARLESKTKDDGTDAADHICVIIDKTTFHIVEVRLLTRTGSILSRCEYRDIECGVALSSDFFVPPDGIAFFHPSDAQEYVSVLRHIQETKPKERASSQGARGASQKSPSGASLPTGGALSKSNPQTLQVISPLPGRIRKPERDFNTAAIETSPHVRNTPFQSPKESREPNTSGVYIRDGLILLSLIVALPILRVVTVFRRRVVEAVGRTSEKQRSQRHLRPH